MRGRTCQFLRTSALGTALAIGACASPPAPAPPPAPIATPAPTPPPAPPSTVTPDPADWVDAPQTPGDWTYRSAGGGSGAYFGLPNTEARFAIECGRATRTVALVLTGASPMPGPMIIRTETVDRPLETQARSPAPSGIAAALAAGDPLLDAIAYSKGRFAVAAAGRDTLYLPAWPEVARVVEDCR